MKPLTKAPTISRTDLKEDFFRLEVSVKFLTYVFGGGVENNTGDKAEHEHKSMKPFDPVTPVRASSVRGQLRYWWRATTGARCQSLEEMRAREIALWGGLTPDGSTPSSVRVQIKVTSDIKEPKGVEVDFYKVPSYAAFPLDISNTKVHVNAEVWDYSNIKFDLVLRLQKSPDISEVGYETQKQELQLALSAWLTFGGYGGRLSRGFGAVALTESHNDITDDPDNLLKRIESLGKVKLSSVPAISHDQNRLKLKRPKDSLAAWKEGIESLKSFRVRPAKLDMKKWPDGDHIRAMSLKQNTKNSERRSFIRAHFGLPIIYQFKARKDPSNHILTPVNATRLPSAIIIRPSSEGRAMALWLMGLEVDDELLMTDQKISERTFKVTSNQSNDPHYTRKFNIIEEFLKNF